MRSGRALLLLVALAVGCRKNPLSPEPKLEFEHTDRSMLENFEPNLQLMDALARRAVRLPEMRELVDVQIEAMRAQVQNRIRAQLPDEVLQAWSEKPISADASGDREAERVRQRLRLERATLALLPYMNVDSGEEQLGRAAARALAAKLGDDAEYVSRAPVTPAATVPFSAELRDGIAVLRLRNLSKETAERVFSALNEWANVAPRPRAILLDLSRCEEADAPGATILFNLFVPGQIAFQLEGRDPATGQLDRYPWRGPADWETPVVARAPLFIWTSRFSAELLEPAIMKLREEHETTVIGDRTAGSGRYRVWLPLVDDGWFGFTIADIFDAHGWAMRGRPVYPDACPVDGELVSVPRDAAASFDDHCDGANAQLELERVLRYIVAASTPIATSSPAPESEHAPDGPEETAPPKKQK